MLYQKINFDSIDFHLCVGTHNKTTSTLKVVKKYECGSTVLFTGRLHVEKSGAGSQDGTHTCQCPSALLLPIRTSITFQRAGLMTLRVSQWVCRERNWSRDWFQRGASQQHCPLHSTEKMDYRRIKRILFVHVFVNCVFISLQKKEGTWSFLSRDFSETFQSGWLAWFRNRANGEWHVFQNVLFALCKWFAM